MFDNAVVHGRALAKILPDDPVPASPPCPQAHREVHGRPPPVHVVLDHAGRFVGGRRRRVIRRQRPVREEHRPVLDLDRLRLRACEEGPRRCAGQPPEDDADRRFAPELRLLVPASHWPWPTPRYLGTHRCETNVRSLFRGSLHPASVRTDFRKTPRSWKSFTKKVTTSWTGRSIGYKLVTKVGAWLEGVYDELVLVGQSRHRVGEEIQADAAAVPGSQGGRADVEVCRCRSTPPTSPGFRIPILDNLSNPHTAPGQLACKSRTGLRVRASTRPSCAFVP